MEEIRMEGGMMQDHASIGTKVPFIIYLLVIKLSTHKPKSIYINSMLRHNKTSLH